MAKKRRVNFRTEKGKMTFIKPMKTKKINSKFITLKQSKITKMTKKEKHYVKGYEKGQKDKDKEIVKDLKILIKKYEG